MQGAVTWEAVILLVSFAWIVAAVVAYTVWQLCSIVQKINDRLTALETEVRLRRP